MSRGPVLVRELVQMVVRTSYDDERIDLATKQSLKNMSKAVWSAQDHLQFSSQRPHYAHAKEDLSAANLDELLEKWTDVSINEINDEA